MNNKQILKLLNKCNAFALKHNNERFSASIDLVGFTLSVNLHDSKVLGRCADVGGESEYYFLVNLHSSDYDPWAKVEKQLALIRKYITENQ